MEEQIILCPNCRAELDKKANLKILHPDRKSSVYTYQWLYCEKCDETFYGEVEEFKDLFEDDVIHIGYRVPEDKWKKTMKIAEECPDNRNKSCSCKSHKYFRRNNIFTRLSSCALKIKIKNGGG